MSADSPGATRHLAQVNIARLRAPLRAGVMTDFAAGLDPVNRLADHSPGFVWRLRGEHGHAVVGLDGDERLARLRLHGPSPTVFTVRVRFDQSGLPVGRVSRGGTGSDPRRRTSATGARRRR